MLISNEFATAFREAGGQSATQYCDLIRFIAVMFVILGVMWSMHHFLGLWYGSDHELCGYPLVLCCLSFF